MRKMTVREFVTHMKEELEWFAEAYEANSQDRPDEFPVEHTFHTFLYDEFPIFMDSDIGVYD